MSDEADLAPPPGAALPPDQTARPGPGPNDPVDYSDPNVTLDAHEDRWPWRARLRRNPVTHLAWRTGVGVVGVVVTVTGLVLVPAPGPGWLIVFTGLFILASEFEFAQRVLDLARHYVAQWNAWLIAQSMGMRALVALGTLALVWAIFWAWFALLGVPGFLPDWSEALLQRVPGID